MRIPKEAVLAAEQATGTDDQLAPAGPSGSAPDLVAPVTRPRAGKGNLPAPAQRKGGAPRDLPAPVSRGPGAPGGPGMKLGNLPAPRSPGAPGVPNLPAPVVAPGVIEDLPAPLSGAQASGQPVAVGKPIAFPAGVGGGGGDDLLAPAGFHENLPRPAPEDDDDDFDLDLGLTPAGPGDSPDEVLPMPSGGDLELGFSGPTEDAAKPASLDLGFELGRSGDGGLGSGPAPGAPPTRAAAPASAQNDAAPDFDLGLSGFAEAPEPASEPAGAGGFDLQLGDLQLEPEPEPEPHVASAAASSPAPSAQERAPSNPLDTGPALGDDMQDIGMAFDDAISLEVEDTDFTAFSSAGIEVADADLDDALGNPLDAGAGGLDVDLSAPGNALDMGSFDMGNPLDSADADPLGGNALDADPLGGNALDADPFGGNALDADPFGGNALDADPFGGDALDLNPLDDGALDANPLGGNALDADPLGGDALDVGPLDGDSASENPLGDDPFASGLDLGLELGGAAASNRAAGNALDGEFSGSGGDDFGLGLAGPDEGAAADDAAGLGGFSLELDLPNPQTDESSPSSLLDIDLPTSSDDAGSDGASSEMGLAGISLSGQPESKDEESSGTPFVRVPRSARAAQVERLERALGNDTEAQDDLELDADVAKEVRDAQLSGAVADVVFTKDEDGKRPRSRLILVAAVVAGIGVLGAGGYFGYSYMQEEKERAAQATKEIERARAMMRSGSTGHWVKAANAASRALSFEDDNAEALGLAAQAHLASYFDVGDHDPQGAAKSRRHINAINEHSASGLEVDKARALQAIEQNRADRAVGLLDKVLAQAPAEDPDALLFSGWALAAADKPQQAIKAFSQALAAAPERPIPALYGQAQAQLALGQNEDALQNFEAVLDKDPAHIGALIGRAQTVSVAQYAERERMYLEIAERDDLETAAPQLAARAWTLAGEQALAAGRLDRSRERFEKALELHEQNVPANLGLARIALREGDFEAVRPPLDNVLALQPDHFEAKLLAAELEIRKGELDAADKLVSELMANEGERENQLERSRIHVLSGRILTGRIADDDAADDPKLLEAIAAYETARDLAGEKDAAIAVSLAELYTLAGRIEDAGKILAPVLDQASADPSLAVVLGMAYARSKAHVEAETWFRKALELVPDDIESRFQLGLALDAQGRTDEAMVELRKAFDADPKRTDIGAELAARLAEIGRKDEAVDLYEKLLQSDKRSVVLLVRAGMYFVRAGALDRIEKLADEILSTERDNPVGLYLRGEALYHKGDFKNALRSFRDAVRVEPSARHHDAVGRAAEQLDYYDEALAAYQAAAEVDPRSTKPLIGIVRVRIRRRDYEEARKDIARILERDSTNADAHHYAGVIHHKEDDLEDAVKSYERALRYDRERAETYFQMGQAYFDLGNERRAAKSLATAVKLAEPTAFWLTQAYLNLGYAEYGRNNRREAVAAWEAYLARNPKNPEQIKEIKKLLLGLRGR